MKIDKIITNSVIAEAEIRWVLKSVTCRYSHNSNTLRSNLFSVMFNNCKIAQKHELGADRVHISIHFGLGHILKIFYWKMSRNQNFMYQIL